MTDHAKIPVPRSGWVNFLIAAFIFVNGAVVGGGLTAIHIVSKAQEKVSTPEQMPDRIGDFLASRLSLSQEQREQVRGILDERQAAIGTIHYNIRPQIESELERSREEIGKILSPPQREQWEKLFDQTQARWTPRHYYQRRSHGMRGPGLKGPERNGERQPAPGREWREGERRGTDNGDRRGGEMRGPVRHERDRRVPGPGRWPEPRQKQEEQSENIEIQPEQPAEPAVEPAE